MFHFRTHDGRVVGLEVKATSTASAADFAGLRALAEAAGKHSSRGSCSTPHHATITSDPPIAKRFMSKGMASFITAALTLSRCARDR